MSQIDYNPEYQSSENGTRYANVTPQGELIVGTNGDNPIVKSQYVFSQYEATLATGATIDSGWLDMESVDKYQLEANSSELINVKISSSSLPNGSGATVTSNTTMEGNFFLLNVTARQRYMKFELENTSTGTTTDNSLAIKATYGSSDKLSVLPLASSPTNFSQAALTQSVQIAQQPDGDFVNSRADGTMYEYADDLLLSGETVSSLWFDTDGWRNLELAIRANVPSAIDGVKIHFTDDVNAASPTTGVTKTYTFTQSDVDNGYFLLKFSPILDGVKIEYTNGDTIQSDFKLSLVARETPSQETIKFSGKFEQLTQDFFFSVGAGQLVGYSSNIKFGHNPDIDTNSTPEDIWSAGGTYTGMPPHTASAETINVFSSAAADTSGSTGAWLVTLYGLDENWNAITEQVVLNGTTPVTTVNRWHRMNRMIVNTGGSGGVNAGIITARHTTTTANVFGTIPIGRNQTTVTAFTIPRGKVGYLVKHFVSIGRAGGTPGAADYSIRVREPDSGNGVFRASDYSTVTTSAPDLQQPVTVPLSFPEKTDIKIRIENVSDNSTVASANFEIILVDDGTV